MVYQDIDIPLPAFIAIDFIGLAVALVPIGLRFWLRWQERPRRPQPATRNLSDALVAVAWLSGAALVGVNTWKNALRQRHLGEPGLYYGVPRDRAAHLLRVSWVSLFFIYISLWASKFALIAYFAKFVDLTPTTTTTTTTMTMKTGRSWLVPAAALFAAATFALHLVLLARWCVPVAANWDVRDGRLCSAVHDIRAVSVSTVANVATDLVVLALPVYVLWTVRRARRARDAIADPTTTIAITDTNTDTTNTDTTNTNTSTNTTTNTTAIVFVATTTTTSTTTTTKKTKEKKKKTKTKTKTATAAERAGFALVAAVAGLSIVAALARWVTLWLVHDVPKANITHTIDVWALVEIVASIVAVCLPSLRAFVRRHRHRHRRRRRLTGTPPEPKLPEFAVETV
ncbi:putative archaeal flagellin n-terminal-like domain-containing protein [Rosellinia necatrix]|uniref:Putative archaeal flagellin n-terminal-like domain-containing protein n=1 Tax=Rosellinia necatrix TaxID=77044 RepID=A0A1W2TJN3_ROSNE|nr:putative archaeal flagellin n-terminal-like domain-containing protein [Rosellinia necatrix]